MNRSICCATLIVYLFWFSVQAKSLEPGQVPKPLQPWIEWVLQSHQDRHCPFLYNSFQQKRCAWPSHLRLDLNDKAGRFSIHWRVFSDSWIVIPGDEKLWPLSVKVNKHQALVIAKNGKPAIRLGVGDYQISGEFQWDFMSDNLTVPIDTGLIEVHINNKLIFNPTIKNGQLWLKAADVANKKINKLENRLDLQVYRKIDDDVPMLVTSHFELEVSGDQREIKLAHPLLDGSIPVSLDSPLPARLEPDGTLLVQVRPGRWQLELVSRYPKLMNQIDLKIQDNSWPENEIWVFQNRPNLRVVEIKKLPSVDPQQTNLPEKWKHLPAFLIKKGETMVINTIRRGDPDPEPNQLSLDRKIWLDFDGTGYTVNDRINGKMTKGWRLSALPEMQLGQVVLDGSSQLITQFPDGKLQGIEVRKGKINLNAHSRMTKEISTISATGWDQNFNQVHAVLNLPPGWRLLAATGVDNDPDSWISQWTLLDLFLVLIASLAISRMWNLPWGVFALFTLAIIWHEPEVPRFIWLNVLAAIALFKVLPDGKLKTAVIWYRNISWLMLLILILPFMINQVRLGLYPQLEKPWQTISAYQEHFEQDDFALTTAPLESVKRKSISKLRDMTKKGYYGDKQVNFQRIDPNANIQTGPGLPQWQWHRINLSWNGSVDSSQQVRLWYVTPLVSKALHFTRAIFIMILTLLLFGVIISWRKLRQSMPLLIWVFIFPLLTGLPAGQVMAQFPDKEILKELEKRLLEAPECLPECAQISELKIDIDATNLKLTLDAHVQQDVAIPLPINDKYWLPSKVLVDKKPTPGMFRSRDGKLWLLLGAGTHSVVLDGRTPNYNGFVLPLPLRPHRVVVSNQGWVIDGIYEHGIPGKQLQFSRSNREKTNLAGHDILQPGLFPPMFRVERTMQLDLDWRVISRVVRLSPSNSDISLEVPLLPGESVTTPGLRIKNGKLKISMAANQSRFSWNSALTKASKFELVAPETDQWTEVWRVDVSPIWHLDAGGIAVVHHLDRQARWLPEWRPWPGEKVTLSIFRPVAVKGQTLTIDKTKIILKPGKRVLEVTLVISLRSSQGGQHSLSMPENARLQTVTINGVTQPIRQKGSQIILPIKPGEQNFTIKWLEDTKISNVFKSSQINMGVASVNNHINVQLGQDRWVLFTWGPKFGPAVLIWGVLVVIILFAFGLGKVKLTPLKFWQWLLLLIGLSQIPIAASLVVIAWLMVLGLRRERPVQDDGYFNIVQVGIAVLTLFSLIILFMAIEQGLLGSPDMQITGNQSTAFNLNWYQDRSPEILPVVAIASVPLTIYRMLMLLWSLWLAVSLLNWLKWGWQCFNSGSLWRQIEKRKPLQQIEKKPESREQGK
jgi:hypothetical protein